MPAFEVLVVVRDAADGLAAVVAFHLVALMAWILCEESAVGHEDAMNYDSTVEEIRSVVGEPAEAAPPIYQKSR